MKVTKQRKMLLVVAIALVATTTSGVGLLSTPRASADVSTNLGGFISYDDGKISVEEDYSAVVSFSTNMSASAKQNMFVKLNDNEAQLDSGKSGLLIKTKQSGTNAEGAGVDFTNALEGNFSMDFRVFSEQSYYGFGSLSAASNDVTPDYYNTFLDAKEIGITLTSVSDPDTAFTVYVRGSSLWGITTPSARVWVKGETVQNGNKGLSGYGLNDSGKVSWSYPVNTQILGTSFVNANKEGFDASTTIEFDVETMCVYAISYDVAANLSYAKPQRKLIRDLTAYPTMDGAASGYSQSQVKLLTDSSVFSDGYTVSVAFTDVTANDTTLQKLNYVSGALSTYHSDNVEEENVTNDEGSPLTYERYGNMIIYSLNGQSFAKTAGFSDSSLATQSYTKWHDGTAVTTTQYEGKETGLAAEGASISYDGKQTGVFNEEICIRTWDSEQISNKEKTSYTSKINGGMGYNADGAYAQFQTKEVAFEFVSAKDSTKSFVLYIRSGGGTWANATEPSARVYIPGDTMLTEDLEYGYGLTTGRSYGSYATSNFVGEYDAALQSKLIGWMGGNTTNNSVAIRFAPTEMKVYGLADSTTQTYAVIRDLATNAGTNVPTDCCASLSADDFADGYYVRFMFTDVRRNNYTGDTTRVYNNKGLITTCGGNADAAKTTSSTATTRVAFRYMNASKYSDSATANYDKQDPTAKIDDLELGEENELNPVFFGVMSNGAKVTGDISYENGSNSGTIAAAEGVYKFTPEREGEYTFRYSVSWNGATLSYETKAQAKVLYGEIIFMNGENELKKVTLQNGKSYVLSEIAPEVSLSGYTFTGWMDGENSYAANGTYELTGDVMLSVTKTYGKITGATITLGGEIGVNFYVELPEEATTEQATFAFENKSSSVTLAECQRQESLYKLTYNVAPKDFRSGVTLTVENGTTKTYSVEEYLNTVMTNEMYSNDDKAIATATRNYCAIAAKYFTGAETDVTIDALTEEEKTALATYRNSNTLNLPQSVSVLGIRLALESNTAIRIYFTSENELTNVACTIDGNAASFKVREDGGVTAYYVEIANIVAKDLDEAHTIKVGEDGSYATISYSALSYVYSAVTAENADEALVEVVTALYRYNVAANAYFMN